MSDFWKRLKESRTLWAVIVGALVIVSRNVWPEFPISDETITQSLMLLGAFVVAEGFEGFRPAENVFATLIKSRKFQATLAGLFVVFAKAAFPNFDFTEEQVLNFVYAIMAIVGATGIEGSALAGAIWVSADVEEVEALG
ncbi:MAG: hypothetical protein KAR20_03695 [Candidatus Heimdallarchaeota archaeon]|nr:hypothetical protein [Candidatus Heimdallarchaeota archaeon]